MAKISLSTSSPTSTPLPQQAPKSFEEAVAELEQLVSQMEQGQQPLEQSIEQYERGNYLLKWCKGVLGEAEKKIERISRGGGEAPTEQA